MSEKEPKPTDGAHKPEELTKEQEGELLKRLIELEEHGGEDKEITEITDRLLLTEKYSDPNDVRKAIEELRGDLKDFKK